jgi:hypothetical protein
MRLTKASCSPSRTGALRLADATYLRLSHEAAAASWPRAVRSYSSAVPLDDGDSKVSSSDNDAKDPIPNGSKNLLDNTMKPSEVVAELDRHIVGQHDAKRAVAIAMRNRWRRRQLPEDLRKEVTPRNVLLVGPTGTSTNLKASRLDCHSELTSLTALSIIVARRMWENRSGEADGPA